MKFFRTLPTVTAAWARLGDSMPLSVEWKLEDDRHPRTLRVCGEIDLGTVGTLRTAFDHALRSSSRLVLDLTGVTFIGCAGLAALESFAKGVRDRGIDCAVATGTPVLRPMRMTGLDRELRVYSELDAAEEGVRTTQA